MIFGNGVFGPEGVLWCCTLAVTIPALYMVMWAIGRRVPGGGLTGSGLLTIGLSFAGAGYLFGDVVGLLVGSVVSLLVVPTMAMGPQRVRTRVQHIKPKRMFFGDDGEIIEMRQDH